MTASPFLQDPCPGIAVSQRFGVNRRFYPPFRLTNGQLWPGGHEGLDFATPPGTPILAPHDGMVVKAHRLSTVQRLSRKLQPPYGEHVRIEFARDGQVFTVILAHLDRIHAEVGRGRAVRAGDVIGYSGNTGRVLKEPGYHLHLGVNVNGYPVDPAGLIVGGVA